MIELFAIAFLGGIITGISPCIVPVLPVVVAGGSTGQSRARPFLIIGGLVVSFSLTELLGSAALSALHLPQNLLFWLGIALLLLLALGLIVPIVGAWIERPFARLGASRYADSGGGFVLGLSLGLVFVPCAGPVLAAISVAAANHRVDASSVFVTIFYAVGAALPLLFFAVLAQRAAAGWQRMRAHLPTVRRVAGVALAATTLAIAFGLLDPLQRAVPGYTSALENHVESSASVARQLQNLSGERANAFAKSAAKAGVSTSTVHLPVLGTAPGFAGIVTWLNTPGEKPLSLAELRGKVVLVDFWTYSCINCQRSLPHVEAWYSDYRNDGFVVIGVHTPEFAFEHVVANIKSAADALGVEYPVAVDNNYRTWDVYNNAYWPAEYLIDPTGRVRGFDFGEGSYSKMESNIRTLLFANGVTHLPAPSDVANTTPTEMLTPESYVGYREEVFNVGTRIVHDRAIEYHPPRSVPENAFALGGIWNDHAQEATAGAHSTITVNFIADDAYLVVAGNGTVDVSFDGHHRSTVVVSGIPRLYTLFAAKKLTLGELRLTFSPGLEAYDFTFG